MHKMSNIENFLAPPKVEEQEMPRLTNEEKAAIKEQFKQQKLAEKLAQKEEMKKKRQEEIQKRREEKALVNGFTWIYLKFFLVKVLL